MEDDITQPNPNGLSNSQLLREVDNLRREISSLEKLVSQLRQADKDAVAAALAALDKRGQGVGEIIGWVIGVVGLAVAIAAIFFGRH